MQENTECISQNIKKSEECLSIPEQQEVKLYLRRFLILFIFSSALFLNGEAWMTFGSVENESSVYFDRPNSDVIWLANIFLVAYAFEAIPCTFMPQIIGLRGTVLAGLGLNLLGSGFRFIGTVFNMSKLARFIICLTGNLWFGLAQGFLLNIPSLVSAVWFGEKERSISTAIAYMSNALGVGIGFLDIYLLAGNKPHDIVAKGFSIISIFEFCFCAILLILAFFTFIETPPTPPSLSQSQKIQSNQNTSLLVNMKSMVVEMGRMIYRRDASILLAIFATNYGSYVIMFVFLPMMVSDIVIDPKKFTGYIGSVGIILGGVCTVIVGVVMFRTENKYNQKISLFINLICIAPLMFILILGASGHLYSVSALIFFIIYFCFCPVYLSVGCEMLADVTYPTDPNITSNEGLILGNILGAVVNYTFVLISGKTKHFILLGMIICFYSINSFFLLFIKFKNRRRFVEL